MNRFKNQILMAAGCAILTVVIGGITAAPAIAQAIKAALVLSIDEPGRQPWQFGYNTTSNLYTSPAVPAGKRLVLTYVSAGAQPVFARRGLAATLEIVATQTNLSFANQVLMSIPMIVTDVASASAPIHGYVEEGRTIRLTATMSDGNPVDFGGMLTGYLIDCTPSLPCAALKP